MCVCVRVREKEGEKGEKMKEIMLGLLYNSYLYNEWVCVWEGFVGIELNFFD